MTDPLVGRTLAGRYEVVRPLSEGGMGALYVAIQRPLGRHVAIKVLLRRHVGDPEAVRRFEKEAHAVSRLVHPHIVTLFDFGQAEGGELYIAMELLRGADLRTVLERDGPLPWRRALHVVKGIASALVEAHRHKIIHRDLKPENVMLVETSGDPDYVKVLDFGLARSFEEVPGRQVTSQDVVAGTPSYLSPERIDGVGDDPRSDLYALGAMWFELLTGRIPYPGTSAIQILVGHMQNPVPSPRDVAPQAGVPPAIDALVRALLAKRAADRPATAAELSQLLVGLDAPDGWQASPSHRAVPQRAAVPELVSFADDAARALDEGALSLAREPDPIPLVHVKRHPAFTAPLVDGDEDDADLGAPIELTRKRGAPAPPLLFRPKVVTSISEAATLLGSARDLDEIAGACVAFLASRFDRALVLDVRAAPRLLHQVGVGVGVGAGPAAAPDVPALLRDAPGVLADAVTGRLVYGPAKIGPAWDAWHARIAGRRPGGVLVGALSVEGAPALLVYADHDRAALYDDLKDVARLLREAAASLSVVGW